jgi:hypothetical protein
MTDVTAMLTERGSGISDAELQPIWHSSRFVQGLSRTRASRHPGDDQ